MPEKQIDVFGVGNAMVDILAMVTDDFVREHAINRGTMTLVDAEKQGALLQDLERHDLQMQSGGSAANTMIAIAQSGGTGFYSGKVSRDTNGEFYRQDMLESGIHFDVHPAPETGAPTGTCLVLTTPDAERTMCTHLGISTELSPSDIDLDRLARCKYAYIEGYLWDPPQPRAASTAVMEAAKRLDVKVSLTYSDPFLMERFGDDFRRVGLVHVEIDTEGRAGEFLHPQYIPLHFLRRDGGAREKTKSPRVATARHQVRVCHPAHGSLHDGVFAAQFFGQACAQHVSHRCDRRAGYP